MGYEGINCCNEGHVPISYPAVNIGEKGLSSSLTVCPLCLIRIDVLMEIAQPRIDMNPFCAGLSSRTLREYPYIKEQP